MIRKILSYIAGSNLFLFLLTVFLFILLNIISSGDNVNFNEVGIKSLLPILLCLLIFFIQKYIPSFLIIYLLFFSISIFSFLGLANNINGSHATSPNPFIYGLSFYGAFLAYKILNKQLLIKDIIFGANPIILISGPIPVRTNQIGSKLRKRILYFFPYLLIGFFFFKVISSPMTFFLSMVQYTTPEVVFIFAVLFRIFLYFNFAGISLMIFGLFGILGVKIPLNFTQPFSSRTIIEFWRSWHVSLSMVLKDLFYNPTRKVFGKTYLAIFAVYFCSALWHGVSLNFLMWGIFHSILFILSVSLLKRGMRFLPFIILLIGIPFGDIMFTDTDIPRLMEKLLNFTKFDSYGNFSFETLLQSLIDIPKYVIISTLLAFAIILLEFFFKDHKYFFKKNYKFLRLKISQLVIMALIIFLTSGQGWDYAAYGQR